MTDREVLTYIRLPAHAQTDLLPPNVAQYLKHPGLIDHVSDIYFTFGDGTLKSYFDLKGESHFGPLDAKELIVLGVFGGAFHYRVFRCQEDIQKYISRRPEEEAYICVDKSRDCRLIILRPFHKDLWFVNQSVSLFNQCAALWDDFLETLILAKGEEDARAEGCRSIEGLPDSEMILHLFLYTVDDIDWECVCEAKIYEGESKKFWEAAAGNLASEYYL